MPIERYDLTPRHNISRVLKGGWQLAGGHGAIDTDQALVDMRAYVAAGVTTFDCADIYTGVEEMIGRFLRREVNALASGNLPPVQVHTKYVPDLDKLATLTYADTAAIIERSLTRLGLERLDLVQFHWWDYDTPGYVEAAQHLYRLQQAGKIKHVAVTNFDTPHLREILDAGVDVVSCQVQYSVLDQRPSRELAALAIERGIQFLCYGSLAGGFLTDRWLGVNEPSPGDPTKLENRSLTKYKLIIDDFGGWDLFQELLCAMRNVADRYAGADGQPISVANVATRWTLQQPLVAGAVVGARHARHLPSTLRTCDFTLSSEDMAEIGAVIVRSPGLQGGVYELERTKGGKHAVIMKYNLNDA